MKQRPSWKEYFMQIALDVAKRGTCLRRCYGAVIVDTHNRIVSTGYCGSPKGEPNCCDIGTCKREELKVPSGQRYELCRSVHAEANAIAFAPIDRMRDATIYIMGYDVGANETVYSYPCEMCHRMIINAGIKTIVYYENGTFLEETRHNEHCTGTTIGVK